MVYWVKLVVIVYSVGLGCSVFASTTNDYKSVIVVGHLYPLYEINYQINGMDDMYIESGNLKILVESINNIQDVNKLILLGDAYVDDRDGRWNIDDIYDLVYKEFITAIDLPVIAINGNHETYNLVRFLKSGGVARDVIDIDQFRILLYSPWKFVGNTVQMQITDSDYEFFKNNLSREKHNLVMVTDMVHHNNADLPRWKDDIVPMLKQFDVRYVICGDNDRVDHRYSWVQLDNIQYIHQGIAHNLVVPNINTFLEVQLYEDGNLKFIPHTIPLDGLSDFYRMRNNEFIRKKPDNGLLRRLYKVFQRDKDN